ncbi:MAG TPA: hypothetical protein VD886_11460 [Herpetosiphonaceae bacterium]|nr:hypothetical protein [Herpetosiphonaceae bacterium]
MPCANGCTLTQGYWKTHSSYGPARYDDTWALIGENTPFYSSGQSYYQVLWTAPKGDVYYVLAHQFIAARLNGLNGASSTPEVNAAMAWAERFFGSYGPSSTVSKSVRNQAASHATLLDNYNNGLVGPGHCAEEAPGLTRRPASSAAGGPPRVYATAIRPGPDRARRPGAARRAGCDARPRAASGGAAPTRA